MMGFGFGLVATRVEEIDITPRSDALRQNPYAPPAELFFREGESVIQSTICRLGKEIEEMPDGIMESPAKLAIFEVQAASYAALGELYYCRVSATSYKIGSVRSKKIQESIEYLKKSLQMVQQQLVEKLKEDAPRRRKSSQWDPLTVESLCSTAPRSLMQLQARTAKDLGKVYRFAERFSESPVLERKRDDILSFARAISSRLHFDDHPSLSNIKRLSLFRDLGSEHNVNQWLSENPLFENI